MASQTRPLLMTGAALASAATLVVATPAIAPSLNQAAITVANGGYNLATFSDIFTIPSGEWISSYFQGYGGIVGPNNPLPLEPWASGCDGGCFIAGLSGVAYLALDALINGNGEGWENNEDWGVGAVNYFFEGGTPGAGIEYILQESIGAANPVLGVLITLIFAGPQLVTVIYDNAVQLLADAALSLPVVGDYVYGALNAYLGPASLDPNFQFYTPGLTGILNYTIDVITGNAPPSPTPDAESAATLAAAPAAAVAALSGRAAAPAVSADAGTAAAPEVSATSTPDAVETATAPSTPAGMSDSAPDSVPASETEAVVDTETEAAPAVDSPSEAVADAGTEPSTDTGTSTDAGTSTDTGTSSGDAAVENPRETAAETAAETPAADNTAKTRKRPIRDAVEKVGKTIGSALKGSKAEAAAGADEADSAS